MRLQEINLLNFRKHKELKFTPFIGINLLYGANGTGKTNILEAIHYCIFAKGLNKTVDKECLNFSADYFLLNSKFLDDKKIESAVKVSYLKNSEKKIFFNGEELNKFSYLIGRIPCVTFSPMELMIINGAPQERRRFIDTALSQTTKRYLDDLLQFRRVLQQRNTLLTAIQDNSIDKTSLHVWNEKFAQLAGSIVLLRVDFIKELLEYFKPVYKQLDFGEIPDFFYHSSIGDITQERTKEELENAIIGRLEAIELQEIYRKQTLVGPHRDDIVFKLNGIDIKKYASQGQQRTFLIALKIAMQKMFYDMTGESPLFLLDDLFSELDKVRTEKVLELLQESGQSIITATEEKKIDNGHCIALEEIL